jgi:hypothetical protein
VRHHTKDKGDIGVACVIADLMKHDVQVALPMSEHLPFDLIAIHRTGRMVKLSVKYRQLSKQGSVRIDARSIWSDQNGIHRRPHRVGDYDAVAIYCPDVGACYYLCAHELSPVCTILRVIEPANNQRVGVRLATKFIDPDRMFVQAPVAQWTEQSPSKRRAEGSIPSGGAGRAS